jgi:hypothetical protein
LHKDLALADLPLDHGGPLDHPIEPFTDAVLEGSIIDRFDIIALRYPDRVAIEDARLSLTYADLAALVGRLIELHKTVLARLHSCFRPIRSSQLPCSESLRPGMLTSLSMPISRSNEIG